MQKFKDMKKNIISILLIVISLTSFAQRADRVMSSSVFKAMEARSQADIDEEMNDAKKDFKKILSKEDNPLANFGLSVVFSYEKYSKKDFFQAYKYFQKAYDAMETFNTKELEVLNEYFFKQNKRRRNRPIKKNMDWEKGLVEDRLIKFVREENNLEYADRFLAEFPKSKYSENVQHIKTYIEYRLAENSNLVESYNTFLKKYPNAAQKEIAMAKRNKLAYQQALKANKLSALKNFVEKYPDAIQVDDAHKLMGELAYKEAVAANSLEAIEQFMLAYPNSTKMPEAKQLKRQLLFEWAKKVNTIDAYNKFVALYPEGNQYIDIFNLKTNVLGQNLLVKFPMDNYKFVRGYDNLGFDDFGGAIVKRKSNDELLLVCNSKKQENESYDTWLLGLDKEGKMLWNSFLGNKYDDFARKVVCNQQNEIYVAGVTNAIKDSLPGQPWVYKLAADGSNIYNTKLEGNEILGFDIFTDGSALIGTYTLNEIDSTWTPIVYKINKKGKKLWSRSYSAIGKTYDLKVYQNTAYLTTGAWICAIDESGYVKWDYFFTENQLITAIDVQNNGNIIVAGKKTDEPFIAVLNNQGKLLWEKNYNSIGNGNFQKITALSDNNYLLSGTFDKSVKILKIGEDGTLITHKHFALPEGLTFNGIDLTEANSVVISATTMGENKDIIIFELNF